MCGIVGYLNLDNSAVEPREPYLDEMIKSIHHRGPDETGRIFVGPAALGMTRLSIIDLKTGQQPIFNEDKSICIVFNGEIYNFQELRDKMIEAGHRFGTHSDTEAIVHLYEEYGIDCLKHMEGMFAFAIWDKNKDRLFIARDRMGEKPLHWGVFNNKLIFGSELKGIFAHPASSKELNTDSMRQYLSLEYVPAPNTLFKGIHKLLPAHYMLVEAGSIKTAPYWRPSDKAGKYTEGEAKEKLHALLDESIRLRMISDVPLGVFLSGGIDSSLITALASRHVSHTLKTFSIGFADRSFDESDHARTVAEAIGTDHSVLRFDPQIACATMQELWQYLDEPIADASIVPTFLLSRMTKKSVTVALSGEGGDELFGGYPTYYAHRLASYWNMISSPLRKGVFERLIESLPVSHNNLSFDYKAKRFIAGSALPDLARQLRWMGALPLSYQSSLLREDILENSQPVHSELDLIPHIDQNEIDRFANGTVRDIADRIMRLDQQTYLADDLLVKSDRSTMAASLEARLPFLAFPLVEFAQELPVQHKVKGKGTKLVLRSLAEDYLPADIVRRPKKGFGIPVAKWLKSDFKHYVDHLLCEDFIEKQALFNWSSVEALLNEHNQNRVDRRKELWTLLMFQWWWAKFFDTTGDIESPIKASADKSVDDYILEAAGR